MTDSAIPFEAPLLAMTEVSLVPADPDSRLAEHTRRLARLFRSAGHDLRGPLHTMALQLELLRQSAEGIEDPELRARQGRYAGAIAKEIARLARMLEAFWGGVEDGGDRFDLRETAEEIRAMIEPHCRRSQIGIALRVPEKAVLADGSRAAARHAGLDLLLQAADRMAAGELTISAEARDSVAVLGVTAVPRDPADANKRNDERTEEAPFAADRIARLLGGAARVRRTGDSLWHGELELPRSRTPESDEENHAPGTHR